MPEDYCFILMPGFSAIGFISAIEPLRVANRFRPGAYRWTVASLEGGPVVASNGMSVDADMRLDQLAGAAYVFVVAGFNPLAHYSQALARALRQQARDGATLGGVDTGAFILAQAGLLGGCRVALHWEARDAFSERFPQLETTPELFEASGARITCAGGTASIDLMLDLITQAHGAELAIQVSEQFVLGRIRPRKDHQRMQVVSRYGTSNRKLVQVITEMEQHSEPPLTTLELAEGIGVTRRQLERLFRAHLNETPSNLYLRIRLDKAQHLLRQTDMSVTEVSVACGFELPSYFARRYKARFGKSPRDDRRG
ncbi:GlxA family transcriptional regulator [Pseudomonas sp. KNUC1026]|uniref:GlxA family transcriptional regulator n=1 Tax=Pseudomonas sp. KNUC1026 TaxID=2893890 RepID=UPI001F25C498|nr:GlxA family transcriptional regulator [Pseudomonas sp. KNUC1026]UFH48903.1 GlxA family transcriptional regulator [Pseudomonas sp. KNUC1026]